MPHLSIHSGLALIDRWLGPLMRTFAFEMTKLFNGSDAARYILRYIHMYLLRTYTTWYYMYNIMYNTHASRHTHSSRTKEWTYVKSHGHCLGSTFFLERIIIYDVRRTSICHLMEPHGFRNYGTWKPLPTCLPPMHAAKLGGSKN